MRTFKRLTPIILLTSCILAVGTLFIPLSASWHNGWFLFHWTLFSATVEACFFAGGALLFVLGVRAYTAKMRRAYALIAVGAVLLAIGAIETPLLSVLDLGSSFFLDSGLYAIPFLCSDVFVYFGARNFAHLVGQKSLPTRAVIVVPAAMILAFLAIFIPHGGGPDVDRSTYIGSVIILTWSGLLKLASGIILWRLQQRIGGHYKAATLWLATPMLLGVLINLIAITNVLITGEQNLILSACLFTLGILDSALYVVSGHELLKAVEY